jgi:hypothetical protein
MKGEIMTPVYERVLQDLQAEEIDIATLKAALKQYSFPIHAISDMTAKGHLIRLKRGWYIKGERYRKRSVSRTYLANVLYGPSYVSLEYALQYYGLIPERVTRLTSVTYKRERRFSTPVGEFTYKRVSREAFRTGMDLEIPTKGPSWLVAIPEKALADLIQAQTGLRLQTEKDIETYLYWDLRIDPERFKALDVEAFFEIALAYKSCKITRLAEYLMKVRYYQKLWMRGGSRKGKSVSFG